MFCLPFAQMKAVNLHEGSRPQLTLLWSIRSVKNGGKKRESTGCTRQCGDQDLPTVYVTWLRVSLSAFCPAFGPQQLFPCLAAEKNQLADPKAAKITRTTSAMF